MTVLASETFIALGLGESTITVGAGAEAVTFVLDFVNETGRETNIEFHEIDESSLRIRVVNLTTPISGTLIEPVHVGTFGGKELFVLLTIHKVGGKGELRQVTFTAYLGREVANGQD